MIVGRINKLRMVEVTSPPTIMVAIGPSISRPGCPLPTAMYHVNAKEIKVRSLPDIDDEFAKDLGKESLDQLKKEIIVELEKKMKVPAQVKRIRGKLNVPRERFRITSEGAYLWAGKPL